MIEREFIKDGKEALFIKEYLRERFRNALVSKIEVVKTPLVTRIIVYAARPALVIGRKGQNIRSATEELKEKFGIENPQIEVVAVQNPVLDAQVQAERIALALERDLSSWRRQMHITLRRIMEAGAKGAEIVIKGKLGARGAKKRKERVYAGYMKKVGDPVRLVDAGHAVAKTRWGTIGVHVYIVHPDKRFPDQITIPEAPPAQEAESGGDSEGKGAEGEGNTGAQANA